MTNLPIAFCLLVRCCLVLLFTLIAPWSGYAPMVSLTGIAATYLLIDGAVGVYLTLVVRNHEAVRWLAVPTLTDGLARLFLWMLIVGAPNAEHTIMGKTIFFSGLAFFSIIAGTVGAIFSSIEAFSNPFRVHDKANKGLAVVIFISICNLALGLAVILISLEMYRTIAVGSYLLLLAGTFAAAAHSAFRPRGLSASTSYADFYIIPQNERRSAMKRGRHADYRKNKR